MVTTLHRSGEGQTVVLLHGLAGSWHVWKPVIELLEPSYDVVALTLPGHLGWPLASNRTMSLATTLDLVVDRLADNGIERPHFAGHASGGQLGMLLAARGFARSITAFSPAGGWDAGDAEETERIARLFRQLRRTTAQAFKGAEDVLADPDARRSILGVLMEHGDRVPVRDAVRLWEAQLAAERLDELLTALDSPLLPVGRTPPQSIVWGTEDHVFPEVTCSDAWREAAPHATWTELEGAGHLPMYDDPDGVARAIVETIARA